MEDVQRAVALVNIEIEDRDSLDAVNGAGVGGRHGHVVIEAEAHRQRPLGVVTGRTHGAEDVVGTVAADQVDTSDRRTGTQRCGLQRIRSHSRVAIELPKAALRSVCVQRAEVVWGMHSLELESRRRPGLRLHRLLQQASQHEPGTYGLETHGRFRMVRAHVMQHDVGMSEIRSDHESRQPVRSRFILGESGVPRHTVVLRLWSMR